ncbi:MAG: class II aldolase/adducin family protein [Saprospiraceae bacterium]|nr:class II aldolase/adducin family protein [Saprospiraceae bacterium]
MKYHILRNGTDPVRDSIAAEISAELANHNFSEASAEEDLKFIFNLTDFIDPRAVHRKKQSEFVVSLVAMPDGEVEDLRFLCYNTLIKTLSNFLICIKPNGTQKPVVYCITPEAGFYHFTYSPEGVWEAMRPIVGAHFVINNRISYSLPSAYLQTEITEQLGHYGGVLDSLGVLPTPFNLHQVLTQESIDHVYELFKLKGLSYGNLSARERIPELGTNTFWMTARGVDKAHLKGVGKDILLVTGYDAEAGEVLVSVPPDGSPSIRVSVDAIEHTLIYQTFPEVGPSFMYRVDEQCSLHAPKCPLRHPRIGAGRGGDAQNNPSS